METKKRIRKAINWLIYRGFAENERALAERLGYTKSSFSQIVNGKVPLSERFVNALCELDDNINSVWILTGEGDMFLDNCLNSSATNVGDKGGDTGAALLRAIDEIGEQRKLTQATQEQVDRLIGVIESMTQK